MGIFDALIGTNTTAAQNKHTGIADNYLQSIGSSNDQNLRNYTNIADQYRQQMNTAASNVLNTTTGAAQNALTSYGQQAQSALQNGVNSAVGTVQGSNAQYAPYVASGQNANTMYADSLGLNGAGGTAAAQSAFTASPGYQFQVDQATDAAARKAAALGISSSGNTLDAITRLGSNLANQEYGQWQSNLNGLGTTGLSAANAVSGNNAAAAGYQYGGGTNSASLFQQLGSLLGTTNTSLGTQQAGLMNGLGSSIAQDQTNLGTSLSNNASAIAGAVNGYNLNNAAQQDSATNHNNGIFSSLLGGLGNVFSQTATGKGLVGGITKL